MRAVISILVLAIIIAIAALATGFVKVSNFTGQPPALTATRNSVSVKGGKPPAFEVEAGSVKVGTKDATVTVPTSVQIRKPGASQAAAATNNAM
jgi:hypothetical protein